MQDTIIIIYEARNYGPFTKADWLEYAPSQNIDGELSWLAVRKTQSLAAVDQSHADLLKRLTGGATIEERDTWQPKSLAASAFLSGAAEPYQIALLAGEAGDDEAAQAALAQIILAKSAAFHMLIGVAARIRAETKAAIEAAPDEAALVNVLAASKAQAESAAADYLAAISAQSGGA